MSRLLRIAFVLGFALSLGMAASQEPPASRLHSLATEDGDFRGCDRDWNHVNDFWSANVADLYKPSEVAVEESED